MNITGSGDVTVTSTRGNVFLLHDQGTGTGANATLSIGVNPNPTDVINLNLTSKWNGSVDGNDGIEATTDGQGGAGGATATINIGPQVIGRVNIAGGGNGILMDGTGANGTGNVAANIEASDLVINNDRLASNTGVSGNGANTSPDANVIAGILGWTQGAGTADIKTAAQIHTTGLNVDGINSTTTNGANSVTNSGTISTNGTNGRGIAARSANGSITVTNNLGADSTGKTTGNITTGGNSSDGISANSTGTGSVSVTNSGNVTTGVDPTTGIPTEGTNSNGIEAKTNSGAIAVTNTAGTDNDDKPTGNITTYGSSADGILATSTSGNISGDDGSGNTTPGITNSGTITTNGNAANGIEASTGNAGITMIDNAGAVTTAGIGSAGITSTTARGDNTVTNEATAPVITTGDTSPGIATVSTSGKIAVTNDAPIQTIGNTSDGIQANTTAGGSITVTNNATIDTAGNDPTLVGSKGIEATSDSGVIEVTNTGKITTAGPEDAAGILALTRGGSDATSTVINTDDVTTVGNDSPAISSTTVDGLNTVKNNAVLNTSGDNSAGITASSDTGIGATTVTNNGAVTTVGKESPAISTSTADGDNTVTNTAAAPLTTAADDSPGITATSTTGPITVQNRGDVTTGANVDPLDGTITASGFGTGSAGIAANSDSGIVTVTNQGKIATYGDENAAGIKAVTGDAGTVDIENSGPGVTTAGTESPAIYSETAAGLNKVVNNAPLATTGDSSDGIEAKTTNGGPISVTNNAQIDTEGTTATDGSKGIMAASDSGVIEVTNTGKITTTGPADAAGIKAVTGDAGTVDIENSGLGVTTQGTESPAIYSETAAGLNKVVNNAPLATTGDSSDGIEAKTTNSGPISVTNNAQIDTVGSTATDGSKGIMATSDTGIIEVTNTGKIATTGPADAAGIKAVTGGDGTITVTNSAPLIETKGDSSDGIVATSDSGTTITNNGPVTTHGADSEAIDSTTAAGNNTVTNTSTLTTLGDNSDGIVTVSTSGKIDVANSGDVTTTGVGSNGIEATTAIGAVKIDNSAAVTSEQAVGVLATATGAAGAFELDNQTTGSISGGTAGVAISGDFATAQINNAGIIGAANDLAIDSTKLGPAGLTIDNSGTITGVVTLGNGVNTMDNAGTWNLQNYSSTATATPGVAVADFGNSGQNVINNSGTINLIGAPGVAADPASVYVPLKDGTVVNAQVSNQYNAPAPAGPVQGQIMGVQTFNSNPGGVIDLTDGGKYTVPGNVLVISGGHTAGVDGGGVFVANGGSLVVNTVLNDAGANSRSDVLVVDSTQLGQAGPDLITVKPVPGFAGAPTLGNNGIPVVEVLNKDASASPDGVFKLNSPAVSGSGVPYVSGGLYGYALMHNGTGADVTDGNWYLRSDLCDINPDSEMCMVPHGKEPLPESPYYRLADSVYTALPSLALQYGHDLLDTLHERVGEEEDIRGRADLNTWTPKTGAWARVFDTHGTQNGDAGGILYGGSPEYDYDFFGLQVGQDLYRKEHDGGSRDHAGLYFAYGHADSDVTHYDGLHGRNQFGAYSLGGYWTHFGQSGWYTDAVLQGTYYDATSTADRDVPDMTTHGNGFAASLEAGKPFRFGHGYFIEPQAQLTYQTIDFADTNDTRANVSFSDVDSLTGRIGARLGHDWTLSRERQMTVWVRPNLWHEFRGDTATTVSAADGTASFHSDLGGTWGELNLGISGQVTPLSSTRCTSSLYANVSYDRSFDGDGQAWVGKVGIRFSW